MAEQADAPDLGSGTQSECAGSSPVNGIKDGGIMEKVLKRYENKSTGQVIIAYEGFSRPDHEWEPFYDGFWIKTDPYGSEQFMKKADFEREYRLIKTPTK